MSQPPETLPAGSAQDSATATAIPAPCPLRRVVLTGFMGSGKSTIGRLLARNLQWRFVDADAAIEAAAGKSIAAIFAEQGEPWFRELEHQTIRRLTDPASPASQKIVLALGGGAIEDARTREQLLRTEGTWLIHLEVSFDTVLLRCRGSEAVRPVLADKANLHHRYQRRLPLYRESHLNLPVDHLRPPAVLEAILRLLRSAQASPLPPA